MSNPSRLCLTTACPVPFISRRRTTTSHAVDVIFDRSSYFLRSFKLQAFAHFWAAFPFQRCWIDMSDVSNSTPPNGNLHDRTAATPASSSSSTGHEGNFVRPSDLLRPRAASRPITSPKPPERPIDRDERAGLVREPCRFCPLLTCVNN